MSQEQLQSPEGIKYGDVFDVSGELASQPVAPQDAAILQSAENVVLGQTPKGGAAASMQSAADVNERLGVVGHGDMTDIIMDQGATVSEADIGGYRVITETIGGQVVGRYGQPTEETKTPALTTAETDPITIGEALEATALSAADKPIDASDAAAIQAAEVRATGLGHVVPGGIAAEAQSAAAHNILTTREEDKTKLADVLVDATAKLTIDKPVTREDAEGVISAEIRNKPELATHPGGVAASVAAAARLNEQQ
ncbi:UNVERIFIED_CONTAM: Late embryogenesis abundant protein D-34 [Sesamum angustifolium]|uniref:Late embryogenesis abundant protein D-34 n=1 Tax=Sesamum angustifolium TaxID=2727405 RepID=A0AAW2QSH5_9LAMI